MIVRIRMQAARGCARSVVFNWRLFEISVTSEDAAGDSYIVIFFVESKRPADDVVLALEVLQEILLTEQDFAG